MQTSLKLLLILLSFPAQAEISVGPLSPEKAKELGITMHWRKNGNVGTLVWIEFKKEGFAKAFNYAELKIINPDGKKQELSALLAPRSVHANQSKDLHTYAFSAKPSQLKNAAIMFVAYQSAHGDVGYIIHVKDHLDLKNIPK